MLLYIHISRLNVAIQALLCTQEIFILHLGKLSMHNREKLYGSFQRMFTFQAP
jgi:hypothetical protein